mmetsp:Transcript_928/g.1844  ORF Transcript_928/g.1844 Transcript_928/m.1844 type:complete len:233 (+) Transcript_928:66-764(+)
MEGPASLRLNRLSMEAPPDLLRGASRGSQVRADSGARPRVLSDQIQRAHGSRREDLKLLRGPPSKENSPGKELASRELANQEVLLMSPMKSISIPIDKQPQTLEEFIVQDLDTFWRWCPTPVDGLHRCGLLVKLFDYCGLTRKENKVTDKVKRLNSELHALGVFTTDRVEPHQRVPYEAFVQSRRLREAVQNCNDARAAWDQKRHGGRCADGKTPLAVWVLSVISMENQALG